MNGTTSMMIAQAARRSPRQVGAAEDVHRRAHPKDEEDRDCGDEEDPDHVLPSLTLLRDGPTLVVMDAFALDGFEPPPILERVAAAATTERGAGSLPGR